MQIDKQDVLSAAKKGLISSEQADKLWSFWQSKESAVPQFCAAHLLYYFGGMLSIAAITVFVTMAWEAWAGMPMVTIAVCLFVMGLLFTKYFIDKHLMIPAGVLATFSLAVVPLAVYHLQIVFGYGFDTYHYPDYHRIIDWRWVSIELATLIVGAIMLYRYRFPFLVFIVAMTLWYLSMDLWPLIIQSSDYSFQDRAIFSMYFGLGIILAAIYTDFKWGDKGDYAFWLYIIGVIVFWGGLSCQYSESEFTKFIYFLINLFMIVISMVLNRRVFAVFGALGVFGYIGHLSYTLFAGSLLFPFVLIAIGILIIFAGIRWPSFKERMLSIMKPYLPELIVKRWE